MQKIYYGHVDLLTKVNISFVDEVKHMVSLPCTFSPMAYVCPCMSEMCPNL